MAMEAKNSKIRV